MPCLNGLFGEDLFFKFRVSNNAGWKTTFVCPDVVKRFIDNLQAVLGSVKELRSNPSRPQTGSNSRSGSTRKSRGFCGY